MSIISPNHIQIDNDDMNWTQEKQQLLENYITNYYRSLLDISNFYSNINWQYLTNLIGVDDIEFTKLKIDEIYDDKINLKTQNIDEILQHWKLKSNSISIEIDNLINSIKLEPFLEEEPKREEPRKEMPRLTKTQRRLSLELMHSRPSINELAKPATATISNVNVLAGDKKKPKTISRPMIKQRRSSLVGEKLPLYIKRQLSNRPQQTVTPKPSKIQINEQKDSRLQNLKKKKRGKKKMILSM
ncbi:unnamed protein product [Candida verbasci]|uniref:Uncharacterized protein n=1 Tax=Candida verbasci TaxID=1227364 RepID=A0A9W4TV29_9ASCO|nr:unnamed protein product [Candida verbasci]